MWCKNCNLETNNSICPVCGEKTSSDFPAEIFWCENCAVPIIKNSSSNEKELCPLCGEKIKYLATDVRPVFPEEKLLLAALLDKDLKFFANRSVWASGSRYFIDGKSLLVSAKKFAEANADSIAEKISNVKTNYDDFNENVSRFVHANRFRLLALKEETFSFIKDAAKNFSTENIIVSFSGGKDSTVVADIVAKALSNPNTVHIFGNTTLEFPSTIEYADRYRKNHPDAIFFVAENTEQNFFKVCEDIGPPARMLRWCCSMFKTGPIAEVINSTYPNRRVLTFYGIRKSESVARSKYNRVEDSADTIKIRRQTVAAPIFFWKDIDVWLYIFAEGLDFNAAYRLGYDRVGCRCCPNNNQRAQFLSRIYMPNESKAWRNFLVDFAKKIGKADPEVYVDSGKWKARQGGNGLASAEDVKLKFTNCTTEEHAKIYRLVKPFSEELIGMFVPFGKIAPEFGRKILHETIIVDFKNFVPIISIAPFGSDGYAVKIKTMNVASHADLQRMAGYQIRKFNACRRCLKCESLCRMGAISVRGEKYFIDPAKCVHCKMCVSPKYLEGGCMMEKYLRTK